MVCYLGQPAQTVMFQNCRAVPVLHLHKLSAAVITEFYFLAIDRAAVILTAIILTAVILAAIILAAIILAAVYSASIITSAVIIIYLNWKMIQVIAHGGFVFFLVHHGNNISAAIIGICFLCKQRVYFAYHTSTFIILIKRDMGLFSFFR